MSRSGPRSGFTLAEILVSILIFSVVSLAMVTILLTSTRVFRAGEYDRASTDEAISALGIIDDDLKHMVAGADHGFFVAQVDPASNSGNCVVALTIEQPKPDVVTKNGTLGEQLVVYWVESDGNPTTPVDVLKRRIGPIADELRRLNVVNTAGQLITTNLEATDWLLQNPNDPKVSTTTVGRKCLFFGAWVSNDLHRRNSASDWDTDSNAQAIKPTRLVKFCTEDDPSAVPPAVADEFPTAVRFLLTLSTGRYAPQGVVVQDDPANNRIRVAGLGAVPVTAGAMVRIEDEWVPYANYRNGSLILDPSTPGLARPGRRSVTVVHAPGSRVQMGHTYSLARIFPH